MSPLLKDGTVFRSIRENDISDTSLVPSGPGREELVRITNENAYPPDCEPARIVEVYSEVDFDKRIMTFVFEETDEDEDEDDIDPTRDEPGGFTVLCAEDNRVNQKLLERCMCRFEQDHVIVANGKEAVEAYKTDPERFRCILMDVSMPVMGGTEATRQIRAFEAARADLRAAFVVGLVATATPPGVVAPPHGFDAFLCKPLSTSKIADVLLGGAESNIVTLYGRLTEAESRPFPLRDRGPGCRGRGLVGIFGTGARGRAVAEELLRMHGRGELFVAGRRRIDVRVKVAKKGEKEEG
ncbi:CheY-like superfamily [Biscogniauxia marginata]|nr:CheY-like superfamily [Biscogniauxia marginata]